MTHLTAARTAVEALTNVANHAHAHTCDLRILLAPGKELLIEVTDDGIGINGSPPGVGLIGMRERAAELNPSVRDLPDDLWQISHGPRNTGVCRRFGNERGVGIPGSAQGLSESGGSLRLQIREPLWKLTLRACASCWLVCRR